MGIISEHLALFEGQLSLILLRRKLRWDICLGHRLGASIGSMVGAFFLKMRVLVEGNSCSYRKEQSPKATKRFSIEKLGSR